MAGSQRRKWRLADLVDFEVRLRSCGEGPIGATERRRYREAAQEGRAVTGSEAGQRRRGLRLWLEIQRGEDGGASGRRAVGAIKMAGWVLGMMLFLSGIGVMRGMLQKMEIIERGYNVWIFLAVALGLQWLLLIVGLAGYVLVRREKGTLSLMQKGVSLLARKISGTVDGTVWKDLLEGGAGYRSVLSWRLARMTQGVAVMFNLGLLAGFFGCLMFLRVRFYWESTLPISGLGLLEILHGMAAPWAWWGEAKPPSQEEIEFALLPKFFFEREGVDKMWPFLMMSLAVYGLLPRVLLWCWCALKERRALAKIDFQAPRHRALWRQLNKVERSLPVSGPADGVVLLDVGGTEVATEALRGFLLRELRVNPEARFKAAVLDEKEEREALDAIRKADLGVVFLVEGWALSPKQITALYERVRQAGGESLPIHFLVLGELREGHPTAPDGEELRQWTNYVDSLRDPVAEVNGYRESVVEGGES